jgi:flagellar hook-associated protein 3 FlgL
MRVTQAETYRNYLANLETLNDRLNKVNEQVSSGKKLTQLKDSPAGSAQLINLSEQASEIDQYQSNVDTSSYFLGMADSILNEVNNLTATIYTKGSQSASESINEGERSTLAAEIRSLREQLVSLGNSQAGGRYIFAGSKTSSAPFAVDEDAVLYRGDEDVNNISVDDGLQVQAGVSGSAAFSSIFSVVDSLLSNMTDNNLTGIKTALSQFASALSGLSLARGEIGASLSVLTNVKTTLDSREASLTKQRSQVEDADMAESVVKLNQVQTALETALSAGGSILQQRNLFDILG